MPQFEVLLDGIVEFEVFCACGNGLCNVTEVKQGYGRNRIIVEPCEKCLIKEYDDGYRAGYEAAD